MTIHNGLPRLSICPPTTLEFDTLPHVVLTQDSTWDPTVLDFDIEDTVDHWHDALEEHELHPYHKLFDEYGNYKRRVTVQFSQTIMRSTDHEFENFVDHCIAHVHQLSPNPLSDIEMFYDAHEHQIATTEKPRISSARGPDFHKLQPFFGWISPDHIKKTFHHTTQLACITTGTLLKKVYKSQNPALNVIQRGEPVATDKLYSDTPAIDNGSTHCQIFVGMNPDVVDIYPMKFSKQFVNTLQDNVRFWGAPTKLVSDRAQVKISGRDLEFLRVWYFCLAK